MDVGLQKDAPRRVSMTRFFLSVVLSPWPSYAHFRLKAYPIPRFQPGGSSCVSNKSPLRAQYLAERHGGQHYTAGHPLAPLSKTTITPMTQKLRCPNYDAQMSNNRAWNTDFGARKA